MPRIACMIASGYPHDITQRGNNRAQVDSLLSLDEMTGVMHIVPQKKAVRDAFLADGRDELFRQATA